MSKKYLLQFSGQNICGINNTINNKTQLGKQSTWCLEVKKLTHVRQNKLFRRCDDGQRWTSRRGEGRFYRHHVGARLLGKAWEKMSEWKLWECHRNSCCPLYRWHMCVNNKNVWIRRNISVNGCIFVSSFMRRCIWCHIYIQDVCLMIWSVALFLLLFLTDSFFYSTNWIFSVGLDDCWLGQFEGLPVGVHDSSNTWVVLPFFKHSDLTKIQVR